MPRNQRKRKVFLPPTGRGWNVRNGKSAETITVSYDEYEAIKLLDYEGLKQDEVAAIMNVSRPTLTRIYNIARQKVATALVKGSHIEIGGGNVEVHDSWNHCSSCAISFNVYSQPVFCPFCKTDQSVRKVSDKI